MNAILNCLLRHCVESIQRLDNDIDQRSSERLLKVHLEPTHFAMPIHDVNVEAQLKKWCRGDDDIRMATAFLRFEDTRTITGIARVMARTHINRQGVANVRQGACWPVQSPRVVNLFDLAPDEASLHSWVDYYTLIDSWLTLATSYSNDSVGKDRHFRPQDISALQKLRSLSAEEARSMSAFQAAQVCGNIGWARVVLGFFTGLLYLEKRFDFRAENVWAAIECARTAEQVDALSREAQQHVQEFGPRLAQSFFADLGSPNFVKPDTHVTDVASAALKMSSKASAQQSIEFVRDLSANTGYTPRAIDKLMYLACSSKFYLAGIKPDKSQADMRKIQLLAQLQRL